MDPNKIRAAIAATEYKYFGDYELSEEEFKAVDILVETAKAYLNIMEKEL